MGLFARHRQRERIAREIAAKHGLEEDYRLSRRRGLSIIAALEEWDLLDEEAKKLLNIE